MTRHLHERSDNVPNVQVALPAALTSPEPAVTLDCEAGTVAEALRDAAAQAPRYAQRIFFKDRLLVSIILNGRHLAPASARDTPLAAGDRLEAMPPVAGG
jgi:molybdopterin converting factor small subunit